MLRRPFCGMAAGMGLGIWAAACDKPVLLAAAAGMLLAGAWKHKGRAGIYMLFMLIMLFFGWRHYREESAYRETYAACLEDGKQLTVQGKLSSKEWKQSYYIYYLTSPVMGIVSENQKGMNMVSCNQIMAYSDSDDYSIGETLILNGTIELWQQAVNEGNFDAQSFYAAQKIDFKLKDIEVKAVCGKANRLSEGLYQLRIRLAGVYRQAMQEYDSGVMTTMVLGDKSLLAQEVKELYQSAGIIHMLCISGLHISVIGMSLYRLLRKCRMGFWKAGIAAGILILCYGNMVGMGVSVQRAIGMFLLSVFAQAAGRTYDSLNALGILAVMLLWDNPFLLFHAGFLFSFAAVIGVVWIGKRMGGEKGFCENIGSGFSIQLATLPLAAWYYFEIPVYAVFINLLVLPFLEILLAFGIAGGFLGLLSIDAAKLVLLPCHLVLWGYQKVCLFSGRLPFAVFVTGRPGLVRMFLYYGMLILWTVFRLWREKKREKERSLRERKNAWLLLCRNLVCGLLLLCFLFYPSDSGFELDFLDVGQGDGSFLRTEEGYTLFIDGGSTDVKSVGKYRILPFLKYKGIRKIDYWFVSHTDLDHISGLQEIIELGYPIGYLVFSEVIEQDEAYQDLVRSAKEQKIPLLFLGKGDILHLENAAVTAVYPECSSGDKNGDSLVLRYEEGAFSALFTGDIGSEDEQKILSSQELYPMDVYKAAHHGSKNSNSRDFLERLSPMISVISCSLTNSYGHPGKEAVGHMEQAGSSVFYTMYAGQIRITREGEQMIIRKYLEPLEVYRYPVLK